MKITTREGLWVSSSFTEQFGSKEIKPSKKIPEFQKLPRIMTDDEIIKELGVQECTLEDIAAFISKPPSGTDDGYWNLFYVDSCVVGVRWRSGRGEWVVAWRRDGLDWRSDVRVFSRNWHSAPLESLSTLDSLTLISEIEERLAKLKKSVGGETNHTREI